MPLEPHGSQPTCLENFFKNPNKVLVTNLDMSVNTKGKPVYQSNIGTY
jgi:hypothetical protein